MLPIIARLKPCLTELKAGRTYHWCRCGRSAKQPFCDGSHQGTGFEPLKHLALVDGEEVLFCGCKQTRTPPFCDGSHSNLPGGAPLDDPESVENRAVPTMDAGPAGRTPLNGNCFVFSHRMAPLTQRGALSYCSVISEATGALYQAMHYLRLAGDSSPVMSYGDRHVILFVASGGGAVIISGRRFDIGPADGVYVRPNEAFQLTATAGTTLEVLSCACPVGDLAWPQSMPANFNAAFAERVVHVDAAQRQAMGPRYYQCLVDKRIGSDLITQFIGHIPESKAAPHRHLYEETIIVLAGEGCMWTDDRKAQVRAGDVIFLPRKQLHSLQSTTPAGMDVVGVIFPGDNPSINY